MMMPVEWPIAAPAANRTPSPARPRERRRLDSIRADFFVDDAHRLSEQERALMGAMLVGLIDQLADDLLASLPPILAARIEPARQRIAARMWQDGLLADEGLVGLLVRRSDEQRLLAAGRRSAEGSGPVDQLVADTDEGVAVAAMAVTVARGRRRDRFGRIGIDFNDLPDTVASALVHALAALARVESGLSGAEADEELARAASLMTSRHSPGDALDAQVDALARAMRDAGRDDAAELDRLFADGEAGVASALLALRAGIDPATGWCLLIEEGPAELMLLARMAGLDRAAGARLLAAMGDALGIADPVAAIGQFDAVSATEVEERRRWFRLPPAYREALTASGGHG